MKRAGRKNQGAWFRTNKVIKGVISPSEITALQTLLTADPAVVACFDAIASMKEETGVVIPGAVTTVGTWVARMMEKGIPLQIYMGKPTFTTYTKTGEAGSFTYTADYIAQFQDCGEAIRGITGRFLAARRELRDILNVGLAAEGNPGGYPDAQDDPPAVEGP